LSTIIFNYYHSKIILDFYKKNLYAWPIVNIKERIRMFKCKRCGHQWLPRSKKKPKACPACKSYHWDKNKKGKTNETMEEVKA